MHAGMHACTVAVGLVPTIAHNCTHIGVSPGTCFCGARKTTKTRWKLSRVGRRPLVANTTTLTGCNQIYPALRSCLKLHCVWYCLFLVVLSYIIYITTYSKKYRCCCFDRTRVPGPVAIRSVLRNTKSKNGSSIAPKWGGGPPPD